ncbi:MAG: thiolase family protein [Planctomycetes bacterium]|nr:thiolase family protein [Planctomycetota bacterium]
MPFTRVYVPCGAYWTSPFCRWNKKFSRLHAIEFAAAVARRALGERGIDPTAFDSVFLGRTVPQPHSFYGTPWLAAMIGAPRSTGPTLAQACATSARTIASAAYEIEAGDRGSILCVTADRTSGGPRLAYPDPGNPEVIAKSEDWVWENIHHDPWSKLAMVETGELVAREQGIDRKEQEEVTLLRYRQYQDAVAQERAFQRRYMVEVDIDDANGIVADRVVGDVGVYPTTAQSLAALEPRVKEGTITIGTMTFAADGNAGLVLCDRERARALSRDPSVEIRLLAFGQGRVEKGYMPKAVVPATHEALARARLSIADLAAIKIHNPFAVNDVFFCRTFGLDPARVNRFGSPLIWGHPQGPTGMRATIELVEELVLAGGGNGLFVGCAGGDTAAALVLRVDTGR